MQNGAFLWFTKTCQNQKGLAILRKTIAVVFIFRISSELRFAQYLWGPDGISRNNSSSIYFGDYTGSLLDKLFFSEFGVYFLLGIAALASLLILRNHNTRLAILALLFCMLLLEARCPQINDGGDNITRLTLIYLLFTSSRPVMNDGTLHNQALIQLHNFGVAAIIIQLIILYWTSGFLKISGEAWQNGTALYTISNIEWFSSITVKDYLNNPVVTTTLTLITMIFQILFPIAIFSRIKIPWILLGIPMHLGIAFFMGLITFSAVMIALELFLISDDEYATFEFWLRKVKALVTMKAKQVFTKTNSHE